MGTDIIPNTSVIK